MAFPGAGPGSAPEAVRVESSPSAARPSGGDGWDFGDDEDLDGDPAATTTTAAAATAAMAVAARGGLSSATGGGRCSRRAGEEQGADDDGGGDSREEVFRLRARLASLRDLVETFVAVDGAAQGLQGVRGGGGGAFDVVRFRAFLTLAAPVLGESGGERRGKSHDVLLYSFRGRPPVSAQGRPPPEGGRIGLGDSFLSEKAQAVVVFRR